MPTIDPTQRRARLLDLLPRVYAAQPQGSAVGSVIDALAQALAGFDRDARHVLHDRWVGLAYADADAQEDDGAAALDRLGALLQIERLPPAIRHAAATWTWTADGAPVVLRFGVPADAEAAKELLGIALSLGDFALPIPRLPGLAVRQPSDDGLAWSIAADPAAAAGLPVEAADGGAAGTADDAAAGEEAAHANAAATTAASFATLRRLLAHEPGEAYRQRLQISPAIRQHGLATPRALLALAIADLGAEACPKFARDRNATLARAVPLGRRKRCPACADPALPCPQTTLFDAWLGEQPAHAASWRGERLQPKRVSTLRSDSLAADRPEIALSADRAVSFPALQSRASGEIVLYTGDLEPGWTLKIAPALSAEEDAALRSYERPVAHGWLARSPRGRAELVKADGSAVRDVSSAIYYLRGARLDHAASRFGGVGADNRTVEGFRCGVLEQAVRTPAIAPGDNDWIVLTFPSLVYRFDAATSRLAAGKDDTGAHFSLFDPRIGDASAALAKTLWQVLKHADPASSGDGVDAPNFTLAAQWVTREPFSFELSIPANAWVQTAQLTGAVALLLADVERARPAGTRARVGFPAPVLRESQPLAEAFALATTLRETDAHEPDERLAAVGAALALAEASSQPDDAGLTIAARFGLAPLASGRPQTDTAAGDRIELRSRWQ